MHTLLLCSLTAATAKAADDAAPSLEQQDLLVGGQGGYYCYRIPSLAVTTSGALLALCEGRRDSCRDDADIDLLLRRSADNGATWGDVQVLADDADNTMGNPCPVVDRETGRIHLFLCRNNRAAFVITSDDDGESFSELRDVSPVLRQIGYDWTRCATGPGHGLRLSTGRMVIPLWLMAGELGKPSAAYVSAAIYSDDHGVTWQPGGVVGPPRHRLQ